MMSGSEDKELPTSWTIAQIADVTVTVEKIDPESEPNKSFVYIDISSVDNKTNRVNQVKTYQGSEAPSRARQLIKYGDILFATVRTYLKNIAIVPEKYNNQVASTGFSVLRASSLINNIYLFFYTLSSTFLRGLESFQRGVSYPAVRDSDVRNQPIPVAPLNEQNRIVEKIEELFSELDKGIEYLKTAQEQLKVYRQSVLKAAFEGKLTEQWREAYADQLETADQLLERIQQERENRYQQQLNDWEEAVKVWEDNGKEGRNPSKPKEPKIVPSLTETDTVNLPELPDSWTWISLAHIKEFSMYGPRFSSKNYVDEGVAILRTTDVSDSGKVDWENSPKLLISDSEYEKYKLVKGDLLITRTGSIGTISVFNDDKKAIAGAFLIHYRLATHINSWFIFYFLKSQRAQNHFYENSTGSGRPNLNVPNIELLVVPLPSPEEQDKIVQMLEEKFSVLDSFEAAISETLKKADMLRQSILKRAFSGNLVVQDPNDEPASILLERIRVERLAAPKPTRKSSTSKKKPRKKEVVDLISVLQSAKDWLSAQDAFRECGVNDGVETEVIEKLYLELRDLEKDDRIEVERRGDEDWLRIRPVNRS